jgi:hypothetical protein
VFAPDYENLVLWFFVVFSLCIVGKDWAVGARHGGRSGLPTEAPGHAGSRRSFLLQLRLVLERLKIHLMLAKEVQAFNRARSFYRITELTFDVSRQNEGWLKSM